ncbi:hypothetical protein CY35_03G088000 [Sphagnum magellanicum]|nr:hypothetical protein CY35_03G088000 [Sphagnum magellanicum]
MEDEGERENQNGGKRSYSLMALSAPMFFSKDERACQRLELRPGKFYTIGRSRSSCDVIFHDNRVSRQHCQVFLEPGSQKLYLLDGAPSRLRTRAETKRLQESRSDDKVLKACERESSALDAAHDDAAIQNPQKASHHLLKSSSSKRAKSSLNGIFLNGQRVEDGACKVLAPGDEVSLVACTKCAQAVDPDFGAAVGFLVKVVPEYERQALQNSLHLPPNNRKTENSSQLVTKSSEDGGKPAIFPAFGPQTTCEPILGKLQSTPILLSEAGNSSLRPLTGGVFKECLPGLLSEKGDLLLGNLGVEALTVNSRVNIGGQPSEDLPELLDISTQKRCSESTGNGLASEDRSRSISMETQTLALETLLCKDAELTISSISVSKRRAIEARSGILAKSLFMSDNDITLEDEKRCTNPINGMPSETFTGMPPANQEPEICDFATVMAFGASSGISFPAVSITSTRRCGEASESCPNPCLLQTGSSITDVKTGLILDYNEGGLVSTSGTLQKNTTMDAEDFNNECTEHYCPDLYEDVCNLSLTLKGVRDKMWPDPKEKTKVCGRSSTEIMKLMRRNRDVQPADGPCTLSCKPGIKCSIHSEEVAAEEKEKASAGTIAVVPHTSIQEEQIIAHKCSIDDSFRGFCLNRLEDSEGTDGSVSLQELLAPLKDLVAIFAATFTGDILWFLTSNNLPADLPVTVACHDYEHCWSTSEKDRTASPYPQWPNLTIVYPPFPDICAFSSKSKEGLRHGIGCHHPKLFLLRFQDKLRVVISSANLNQRQWLRTTNTVWWRDFPQLKIQNYHALFHSSGVSKGDSVPSSTAGDFGAQLAYFVSCLLVDVPAMAHWVVGLAQYDFSGAEASLIVSIPGVHGSLCSSVHQSSMENLELGTSCHSLPRKLLGIVSSTVVGITFRFCAAADPNGSRVRALAKLLNSIDPDEDGMIVVLLRRAKNVPADCNAVSVVVSSGAMAMGAEAFLQEDVRRDSNSPSSSQDQCIQLGFLPRNTAKSVAPLCDGGLFAFIARIWPKEALSVASGFSDRYVRLNLYIYENCSRNSVHRLVLLTILYPL